VLDADLPGMDGVMLLQLLRQQAHRMPALVLDRHADPALGARVMAAGGAGVLRLPLEGAALDSAIAEAIFALAKFSGAMIDGNLDQPVAGSLNECWNEPMHALERHKRPDAFAPHRFESAARVAHAVFRETAADKIGNPAGEAFDERVLALRAVAADQIRATLNPSLEIQGVVLTMHDARLSLSKEVAQEVRAFFGPAVDTPLHMAIEVMR